MAPMRLFLKPLSTDCVDAILACCQSIPRLQETPIKATPPPIKPPAGNDWRSPPLKLRSHWTDPLRGRPLPPVPPLLIRDPTSAAASVLSLLLEVLLPRHVKEKDLDPFPNTCVQTRQFTEFLSFHSLGLLSNLRDPTRNFHNSSSAESPSDSAKAPP
jgi:hypothetical protein